jgi:hypothetical protein
VGSLGLPPLVRLLFMPVLFLFPRFVASQKQGFDGRTVPAGAQFSIMGPPSKIDRGIVVGQGLPATRLAEKRFLRRAVFAVGVVAPAALL